MTSLTFVHQNIRSMRSNFNNFIYHLDSMESLPSLIFLTEVWIEEYELDNYKLADFSIFGKCNNLHRAGGTIVFVHDSFNCKIKVLNDLKTADGLVVYCSIENQNFTIICLYRLHAYNMLEFLDELNYLLDNERSKNLCIVGEINIDILSDSREANEYLLLMAAHGLQPYVSEPTRIISNSCIDHLFARENIFRKIPFTTTVHNFDFNDHSAIIVDFDLSLPHTSLNDNENIKCCINYQTLNDCLLNESWNEVYKSTDVNISFDKFLHILQTHVDSNRYSYHKITKNILKPWITYKIKNLIALKNNLYKKVIKNPLNKALKERYTKLKKKVNVVNKKSMEEYYKRKFEFHKGNSKKQWEIINSVIGESKRKIKNICVKDEFHVLHSDTAHVANMFNKYFATIPTQLTLSIDNVNYTTEEEFNMKFSNRKERTTCFFAPVDSYEILCYINGLKNSDSCGFDGISNKTLKLISLYIISPIEHIFNLSLLNGICPSQLKKAVILSLFKKGDPCNMSNYHPISLLSVFSKILEKIIKKRIFDFLSKSNFLSELQFGFRPKMNTEDALLKYFNHVYLSLNANKKVAGLFIDVTKAFDTVNHVLLLDKMCNAGFRGKPLNLMKSYLSYRSQTVVINGVSSRSEYSSCGVPQGSVLGPILFLIYINSLCKFKFNGNVVAFADDTAFCYEADNWSLVLSKVQTDLMNLKKWFSIHSMVLSCKTRFMPFVMRNQFNTTLDAVTLHSSTCVQDHCDDKCITIEKVLMYNYLGITIDTKLEFTTHVAKLSKQMKSAIRKFYLLKDICSNPLLKSIYYALVDSKLNYGLALWGGTYFKTLKEIMVAQKYIIRIIHRKPARAHSFRLFVNSEILPLRYLFVYNVLNIFFTRGGYIRTRNNDRYGLRLNSVCVIDFTRKEYCRRFYRFIAPKLYNLLPPDVKSCPSKNLFLRELKKWLLSFEDHINIELYI